MAGNQQEGRNTATPRLALEDRTIAECQQSKSSACHTPVGSYCGGASASCKTRSMLAASAVRSYFLAAARQFDR